MSGLILVISAVTTYGIFSYLRTRCRRITEANYLRACSSGDMVTVRAYLRSNPKRDINQDFLTAVTNNNLALADFFVQTGAFQFDPAVKIACERGYLTMAEFLLKKGANPKIAKRYAKSSNILSMIHRHMEKIEVIRS